MILKSVYASDKLALESLDKEGRHTKAAFNKEWIVKRIILAVS